MSRQERLITILVLLPISATVTADLISDSREGSASWHLFAEGSICLIALTGIFYLIKDTFLLKRDLLKQKEISCAFKNEARGWQNQAKKYLQGLSQSIDIQLSEWKLTAAEKEVAFLLLKGMSLKEIASIRNTTEKTARVQSMAIYSKAGLSGRSELAAFFLEDLMLPLDMK